MPNLIEIIKMAAVDAVKASNPAAIVFGAVTSISPLKVNIEQRLTLDESHLVLSSLVSDFEVEMTMDHLAEDHTHTHTISDTYSGGGSASNETHNHAITGKKTMTIHLGLKVDETVMLLQVQGGQKYIILDRVR